MSKILCFSWNTERVSLCENFTDAGKSGTPDLIKRQTFALTKRNPCYNPLFFQSLKKSIIEHDPEIVVISTEGDLESGTYFHSDFLPYNMYWNLSYNSNIRYRLLVRDKYKGSTGDTLRMSIYVKSTDTSTKSIELNKGLIFNNNNYECGLTNNTPFTLVLALYVQTQYGNIAFINVQMPENVYISPTNRQYCINNIDDKFVENKNVDYVFLMGDFTVNKDLDTGDLQEARGNLQQNTPNKLYNECKLPRQYDYINSSDDLENTWENIYGTLIRTEMANEQSTTRDDFAKYNITAVGYHNRIYYKVNIGDISDLRCIEYETVRGSPMLKNNHKHLGIMGTYIILHGQEIGYGGVDEYSEECLENIECINYYKTQKNVQRSKISQIRENVEI